jgi:hypothetical protein
MKKNVGTIDRTVRIIIAIVIAVLYFTNTIIGTWGAILLVVGAVLLLTSLVSFCPLYALLGLNSGKENKTTNTTTI